jgi:hypothetical protein
MSLTSILLIVVLIVPVAAILLLTWALCAISKKPTPHPTDEDVERSFDDIWNYGGSD